MNDTNNPVFKAMKDIDSLFNGEEFSKAEEATKAFLDNVQFFGDLRTKNKEILGSLLHSSIELTKNDGDKLTIYPLVAEVYFSKDHLHDMACHKNKAQKGTCCNGGGCRFWLYIHQKVKEGNITNTQNGFDLVIQHGDYYYSILIKACQIKDGKEEKRVYKQNSGANKVAEFLGYFQKAKNSCDYSCEIKPNEEDKSLTIQTFDNRIGVSADKECALFGCGAHVGKRYAEMKDEANDMYRGRHRKKV